MHSATLAGHRTASAAALSRALFFAWGAALGVPDLALPLGDVVRARLDDLVVALLLGLLAFIGPGPRLDGRSRALLRAWLWFAGVCLGSLLVGLLLDLPVDWYPVATMGGTLALLLALTQAARERDHLIWLCRGLLLAALLLMAQLLLRYDEVVGAARFAAYSEFKEALRFATWNPNTVGALAIPLSFAAGLGFGLERGRWLRRSFLAGAALCGLIPIFILARGPSVGMVAGWLACLAASGAVRLRVLVILGGLLAAIAAWVRLSHLGVSATAVDLRTGEGFSGRYTMWSTAWRLFAERPLLGWGFAREGLLFRATIGKGAAHSVYLTTLLELGVLGIAVLANALARTLSALVRSRARDPAAAWVRACLIGLLAGTLVAGLSQGVVWQKPWILAVSLVIICFRLAGNEAAGKGGAPR